MLLLPFNKLDITFDLGGLKAALEKTSLWGEITKRTEGQSPHNQSQDIWVRFLNPKVCEDNNDWSLVGKPHKSTWLKNLPQVKEVCDQLMEMLEGEQLGGVLLTKLPPYAKIRPHMDQGWHAEYYDKYYVAVKNKKGAVFCFEKGTIEPNEGEVYAFRNDVLHWVENNSDQDRFAMIVCIKQSKLDKRGMLCHGDTQPPQ